MLVLHSWSLEIKDKRLGGDTMAPSGLYARLCHAFLVFFIFFNMSKAISVSTGPIFTIFLPNGRYLREFSWSGPVFPIPQGTLPWQPILCSTRLACSEPKYLRIRWTDFHNLYHTVDVELQIITTFYYFRYLKGCCHGNQLKSKNWRFLRTNLLCRAAIRKSTISTYLNDNAHTPLKRFVVYMINKQVCNRQNEPMEFRPKPKRAWPQAP